MTGAKIEQFRQTGNNGQHEKPIVFLALKHINLF